MKFDFFKSSFLVSTLFVSAFAVPAPEQFFHHQPVDHLDPNGEYAGEEWTQRYYTWEPEFQGPGNPIFLILGGEGQIEPETGLYYPFITHHLAKQFGAYVLQPEHRFYGKSQPLLYHNHHHWKAKRQDRRVELFTSEQALHDAMNLLRHIQEKLGCSSDHQSELYCPVITVGGSYPGFLSALARIMFPSHVDMAYSASAPMLFYAQRVDQDRYYDHITKVSEDTFTGCADSVRIALSEIKENILQGKLNETILGICEGTTPTYIDTQTDDGNAMLWDELMMVVGYTFANDNMANYPPGRETRLYKACETFSNSKYDSFEKLREFLITRLSRETCWNMTGQLPTGTNATISSGDWSGVGTGTNGESWDFQTCTREVEAIGFSESSMFPKRSWSLDWLTQHCQSRFGVTPNPFAMVRRWKFDRLVETNVTRIIFTNGLKDGWSVGGFTSNLSESLPVLNFPNGAHHSDLSGRGPSDQDTKDIQDGFKTIATILGKWLDEILATQNRPSTSST